MDEVGPHAMKKRTLKSDMKKKGKQSKADPKRKNYLPWKKKDGLLTKQQFIMEQGGDIIIFFVCSWSYDIKLLLWRNYGSYHLNSK